LIFFLQKNLSLYPGLDWIQIQLSLNPDWIRIKWILNMVQAQVIISCVIFRIHDYFVRIRIPIICSLATKLNRVPEIEIWGKGPALWTRLDWILIRIPSLQWAGSGFCPIQIPPFFLNSLLARSCFCVKITTSRKQNFSSCAESCSRESSYVLCGVLYFIAWRIALTSKAIEIIAKTGPDQ